jgi:hypothetical protein
MRRFLVSLVVGLGLLPAWPLGALAAVYLHVDQDGTSHFTDAPTSRHFQPVPAFGLPPNVNLVQGEYADLINEVATQEGVDPDLIKAIIKVESNFNQFAVSRKGARGLMQLMPETAGRYAVTNAFDAEANIRGGVRYLRYLQDTFGNLSLALASYNAGENAVLRHRSIPPFPETKQYVKRVLSHYGRRDFSADSVALRSRVKRPTSELIQPPTAEPKVYRRLDANGVPLFTDLPLSVRPLPGASQ